MQIKQPTMVLEVSDLKVVFPSPEGVVRAVDGVDFEIRAGETLGLVGESGSGKSVTAMSLMRLLPPSARIVSGAINILGRDVVTMPEGELRRLRGAEVSMVFQDPMTSLNPVMTVRSQVEEVIRVHARLTRRDVRQRAAEVLDQVGVARSRLDDYPHRFSGGMRQRVTIAIAFANRPKLLIADEPTTALDVTVQAQILSLLRDLSREFGTAILLISHNVGVMTEVCQRMIVMYAGQLMEQAPVATVVRHSRHPYTLGLMRSVPRMDTDRTRALVAIDGRPPDLWETPPGCPFHVRCALSIAECLVRRPPLRAIAAKHSVACWRADEAGDPVGRLAAWTAGDELPTATRDKGDGAPILEIKGLQTHFPLKRRVPWGPKRVVYAVDGVDLTIREGSIVGLVGESGCGKSTLARTILGVYRPTAGTITFRGQDLATLTRTEWQGIRRRIQMVFQDPYASLDSRMTIGRIVGEPLQIHALARGEAKAHKVSELLELVGLSARASDRYPHEFSGGQRQRIGIARAVAVQPEFIVCDEPLSSLDVSVQAQIVTLLQNLQREFGLTYLLVSHDLAVVRYLSDEIAVMYLGKIVEVGDSESVCAKPLHPYTAVLLAAAPDLGVHRSSTVVRGDVPDPTAPPSGCRFHTRCPIGPLARPERTICREIEPPLAEHAAGRLSACHFAGEIAGGELPTADALS